VLHNRKKVMTPAGKEAIELKKKLRMVKMENEILRKAALIFGRGGSQDAGS